MRAHRGLHRRLRIVGRSSRRRPCDRAGRTAARSGRRRPAPPRASCTASSTDRLNTPGIDDTSRRTPSPSQTNSGSMNMSGDSRVSRTSARIASRAAQPPQPARAASGAAVWSVAMVDPAIGALVAVRSARRSRRPAPARCSCVGMIVVVMPSCAAASAVTGPIDATTVVCSRSAACSAPSILTKLRTADALVNVTTSISPLEQHAVDVGLALALRLGDDRAVGDDFGDVGALLAQLVGDAPRARCRRAAAAR